MSFDLFSTSDYLDVFLPNPNFLSNSQISVYYVFCFVPFILGTTPIKNIIDNRNNIRHLLTYFKPCNLYYTNKADPICRARYGGEREQGDVCRQGLKIYCTSSVEALEPHRPVAITHTPALDDHFVFVAHLPAKGATSTPRLFPSDLYCCPGPHVLCLVVHTSRPPAMRISVLNTTGKRVVLSISLSVCAVRHASTYVVQSIYVVR